MTASPALAVAQRRAALPTFVLPPPKALACAGALSVHPDAATWASLAADAAARPLEDPGCALAVRTALSLMPQGAVATDLPVDPHDAYFHLSRTGACPEVAYLRGLVAALEVFLSDCADEDEVGDYAAIGDALIELWMTALGVAAAPRPMRVAVAMKARAPDPLRRWLRGHHVFAAITQGLIRTLHGFEHSGVPQDRDTTEAHLGRITRLYHASAAAFRFTADFHPEVYTEVIRPSMSEPHVPPGFSGSMSLDHGELVAFLSRLRQPLAAARALCPETYAGMSAALAQVYDDHRWVCERFAGTQGPSLRTDRLCGDNAAVHMIDRFKARRLDMLG
jgi:hypothetical protein